MAEAQSKIQVMVKLLQSGVKQSVMDLINETGLSAGTVRPQLAYHLKKRGYNVVTEVTTVDGKKVTFYSIVGERATVAAKKAVVKKEVKVAKAAPKKKEVIEEVEDAPEVSEDTTSSEDGFEDIEESVEDTSSESVDDDYADIFGEE